MGAGGGAYSAEARGRRLSSTTETQSTSGRESSSRRSVRKTHGCPPRTRAAARGCTAISLTKRRYQSTSHDGAPAREKIDHDRHDREHEQQVHQATDRVNATDSEQPGNEQNRRDEPKNIGHLFLLPVKHRKRRASVGNGTTFAPKSPRYVQAKCRNPGDGSTGGWCLRAVPFGPG